MAVHKSRKHSGNVGRAEVLKTLHSTFRKLLEEQRRSQHEVIKEDKVKEKEQTKVKTKTEEENGQELVQDELVVPVKLRKRGRRKLSEVTTTSKRKRDTGSIQGKNGIIYIRSKERALIPNLSAEETLRRHKQADENMKRAWESIIQKYENINDDVEGDLVDLKTGRIVRDNGHLRRLSLMPSIRDPNTEYKATLDDLFLGVDRVELPRQRHKLNNDYSIQNESEEGEEEEEEEVEEEEEELNGSILLGRGTDGDDFSLSSNGSY